MLRGKNDERARERATSELQRYHKEMVRLWGENYPSTPQYERAIDEIACGRYAWMVLADYRES